MSETSSYERIFRQTKTIAVIGLSSQSYKPGYYVPAYLQNQGYRIIPVNPHLTTGLGERAYAALSEVPGPVDLTLVFRRSEQVPPFVDQSIELGIPMVWLQLGIQHHEAAARARNAGLIFVQDACMMVEHRHWKAAG